MFVRNEVGYRPSLKQHCSWVLEALRCFLHYIVLLVRNQRFMIILSKQSTTTMMNMYRTLNSPTTPINPPWRESCKVFEECTCYEGLYYTQSCGVSKPVSICLSLAVTSRLYMALEDTTSKWSHIRQGMWTHKPAYTTKYQNAIQRIDWLYSKNIGSITLFLCHKMFTSYTFITQKHILNANARVYMHT